MASIPILPWPYQSRTYTDIQPFTERDGLTFIRTLAELEQYMRLVVTHLDGQYSDLVTDWNNIVGELTDKVNESIAGGQTQTDEKIAELQAAFDVVVQQIINDSIELQDVVLKAIVQNPNSDSGAYLRTVFATITQLDAAKVALGTKITDDIAAGRTSVESWANGKFRTALQVGDSILAERELSQNWSNGKFTTNAQVKDHIASGRASANPFPRLRKVGNGPILTFAQQSMASLYLPHMLPKVDGSGTWAMLNSTDHEGTHTNSGISLAEGPNPLSQFTDKGRVYRDDTVGMQTETPSLYRDDDLGRYVMIYQQGGNEPGRGQQSSYAAWSTDLRNWTRLGLAAEQAITDPGDGHTGYMKVFKIAGSIHAFGLYGQQRWMHWTLDPTAPIGEVKFISERNQLLGSLDLLGDFGNDPVGAPSLDPTDPNIGSISKLIFSGSTIVNYRGRYWKIGSVVLAGGGIANSGKIGRVSVAPLSEDMRNITAAPVDIQPPMQGWEKDEGIGFGNVFEYEDKTYVCYRAGGMHGAIGIMEVY